MLAGNDKDHVATSIAHALNLRGPAMNISTACSTSLVSIAMACQSLWTLQCDLALAGGVSIHVPLRQGYLYQPGGVYSPDGRCRPYDRSAQGTVGGSGCGMVLLKRLAEAKAVGDHIYAVIRGCAVTNDGDDKAGYTAPSASGQTAVISDALHLAGVPADSISLVEGHGTGTVLGDPIEAGALTAAFRSQTPKRGYCALGSVKSNVGHLDAAAGVASLIKAALALHHRRIPASLHFEAPNPALDLEASPFFVPTQCMPWTVGPPSPPRRRQFVRHRRNQRPRCARRSPRAPRPSRSQAVLAAAVRANPRRGLAATAHNLAAFLREHPDTDLHAAGFTLAAGRRRHEQRACLMAADRDEAIRGFGAA